MYVNRVSQSHDEEEGCVHNDVYIVNMCLTCWVRAPRCTRNLITCILYINLHDY